MVTLPDDKCLTVRGFGAACQILTWPLLYANALDACVPAEGIRFPGSFILAEERGHGALTPASRAEDQDREQRQTLLMNFLLSASDATFLPGLRLQDIALYYFPGFDNRKIWLPHKSV